MEAVQNASEAAVSEAQSVNQALEELRPGLTRMRLMGGAFVLGVAALSIWIATLVGHSEVKNPAGGVLFTLIFGAMAIGLTFTYIRSRHERLIMPILARTVGLTHEKGAQTFLDQLPSRLLPPFHKVGDDVLSGEIGGRFVQFGEVLVRTRGKNQVTMFKGLVISFSLKASLPEFFVADESQTKGFLIFGGRIKVDGLEWKRSMTGASGRTYGLWAVGQLGAETDRLKPILNALLALETDLGGDASLYTAASGYGTLTIAIRHPRDLFKIGGLMSNHEALTMEVRQAMHELSLPMRVVTRLLEAEAAYVAQPALT